MIRIPDTRRRVAFRAFGAVRLLGWVHETLEDVEGAVGAGQFDVAAFQARSVVLGCLSIRSLAAEGEVDFCETTGESASFDFFAGLADDEVADGLSLAHAFVGVEEEGAREACARLRAYADQTESLLGYDSPLPVLRSAEGALGVIGLIRRWAGTLEELGLPSPVPEEWTPESQSG
jgi:hypothetical protein